MSYPNTVLQTQIDGISVYIVGEHKNNQYSEQLCESVIENENPSVVAIESCPERFEFYSGTGYQSSGGSLAAEQYVRETDAELFLLDILQSESSMEIQLLPDNTEHLQKEQPEFDETAITENGGIESKSVVEDYLEAQKAYSEKRFEFIWNTREEYMANTLLQKFQLLSSDDTVVVILSLSHIYRFKTLLEKANIETISLDSKFVSERSLTLEYKDLVEERV